MKLLAIKIFCKTKLKRKLKILKTEEGAQKRYNFIDN